MFVIHCHESWWTLRSTRRPSASAQSTTCRTRAIHAASIVYGAVADWCPLQVTGMRTLRNPCARMVSNSCFVTLGLPHDVSSGMASRVLPRFHEGCILATMRIASAVGDAGADEDVAVDVGDAGVATAEPATATVRPATQARA